MPWADIRDEFVTQLKTVSKIGVVDNRLRDIKFWPEWFEKHKRGKTMNVWEVARQAKTQNLAAVQGLGASIPLNHDIHMLRLFGHLAFADADDSQAIFDTLIDAIGTQFRDTQLDGNLIIPTSIQVESEGFELWGAIFTHSVEMTKLCEERISS